MNWTGGRLHRSKANANTLIKTQKQHFARARLRLQNGQSARSPFAFSIFGETLKHNGQMEGALISNDRKWVHERSYQDGHLEQVQEERDPHQETQCWQREAEATYSKHPRLKDGRARQRPKFHGSSRKASQPPRIDHTSNSLSQDSKVEHNSKFAAVEVNTIENVKRGLLERSDWMGLSAARPLQIGFASIEEMDRIGKRRKITKEDRQSRAVAIGHHQNYQSGPNRILRGNQAGRASPILNTDDISIRIGRNIHQTQTTTVESDLDRPTPPFAGSIPSESMLLDDLDTNIPDPLRRQESDSTSAPNTRHSLFSVKGCKTTQQETSLPFLDQILDSESFDEVKARSASSTSNCPSFLRTGELTTITRRAAKQSAKQEDSSSIVKGYRILPSPTLQPERMLSQPRQKQSPKFRDLQAVESSGQIDHRCLFSSFRPRAHSRGLKLGRILTQSRITLCGADSLSRVVQSYSPTPDIPAKCVEMNANSPKSEPRSILSGPPVFTLERQVLQEEEERKDTKTTCGPPSYRHEVNSYNPDNIVTEAQVLRGSRKNIEQDAEVAKIASKPSPRPGDPPRPRFEDENFREPISKMSNAASLLSQEVSGSKVGQSQDEQHNPIETSCYLPLARYDEAPKFSRSALRTDQLRIDRDEASRARTPQTIDVSSNQTWIKSALRTFDNNWIEFEFEQTPPQNGSANGSSVLRRNCGEKGRRLAGDSSRKSRHEDNMSAPETIKTSANTATSRVEDLPSSERTDLAQPTKTSFLTQMRAMEGHLDEELADNSVYNNTARTGRSYTSAPSIVDHSGPVDQDYSTTTSQCFSSRLMTPLKRTWTAAFANGCDKHIGGNLTAWEASLSGSGSTHRQPLRSLPQRAVQMVKPSLLTHEVDAAVDRYCPYFPTAICVSEASSSPMDQTQNVRPNAQVLRTPQQGPQAVLGRCLPIEAVFRTPALRVPKVAPPSSFSTSQRSAVPKTRDTLVRDGFNSPRTTTVLSHSKASLESPQHFSATIVSQNSRDMGLDEYPFDEEEALKSMVVNSPDPATASSTSGCISPRHPLTLPNIQNGNGQSFFFRKPNPFAASLRAKARR